MFGSRRTRGPWRCLSISSPRTPQLQAAPRRCPAVPGLATSPASAAFASAAPGAAPLQPLHVYGTVFHGFSASVPASRAEELRRHPAVLAAFEELAMAGEDTASPAAVRKLPKVEEEDDDELDNVPLAISRPKKPGNATASKVKNEEDDDEEDNMPISRSRAKKGNEKGTTNRNMKASKVKMEEADSDDDVFMPTSQKKSAGAAGSNAKTSKVKKLKDEDLEDLKEVKKRKKRVGVKEEANMTIVKAEKVKKERKVYELPGQKHDPPAERDPLRIFYESLYEQVPTSDMAATWLMEWGLLPLDVATKVFEKKQGQKFKSPVKTTVAKRKPSPPAKALPSSAKKSVAAAKSAGKQTSQNKRKASDDTDGDDDDFMAPKTKTKRHKA